MLLDRKQKEEGWLLLNLGATHDVWVQARAIGVSMAAIGARSKRYAMAADAAERFATTHCAAPSTPPAAMPDRCQ
jgi:hypothetical protein